MEHTPDMIFIVGNSRSGTTMLSRILGMHSSIFSFHELHYIETQISSKRICSGFELSYEEAVDTLSILFRSQREGLFSKEKIDKYHAEANLILNSCNSNLSAMQLLKCFCNYEANLHGKTISCEQTPKNIYYAEEIFKLLPNSKIINMYRDPRDVMLSQKMRWKRRYLGAKHVPLFRETIRSWLNYHPITMSKLWVSAISESLRLNDNDNFINIRFEDLLNNPEDQIKFICNHLGIQYENNMLNVPQVGSSMRNDNSNRRGIDNSKQNMWVHGGLSKGEIGICQKICGPQMNILGYEIKNTSGMAIWWVVYGISFVIKMTFALIFNIHRTKSLATSIKRRLT